jgi:fructosamine-3-kinase
VNPGPIPRGVAEEVSRVLGRDGTQTIRHTRSLGGGCIHPAARIETGDGRAAFLKWSGEPGFDGFSVEARGLVALAERGGLRIPTVLGVGTGKGCSHTSGWDASTRVP